MIEVEGNIDNHPIAILFDSRASHIYIDHNLVEIFKLKRCENEKFWLVKLAIGSKRRIIDLISDFPMKMNGVNTKVDLNIISLGSYDCLIGMD
jgi:hypothetical protein